MPPTQQEKGREIIGRRSAEWAEHQLSWRWLLDSLEGGERYRNAHYGVDPMGMIVRNLIRHKREYPDPMGTYGAVGSTLPDYAASGQDQAAYATYDDYELRRARTPVPTFVAEAVDSLLDKVFASEVSREAPEGGIFTPIHEWWADVNGVGTTADDWMRETIGRLVLTLGQIDVLFDHPKAPNGETVDNQADVNRLGLNRCVASFILPENMLWWTLNHDLSYGECLVREFPEGEEPAADGAGMMSTGAYSHESYRHWTATESTLYNRDGTVASRTPHPYGVVPIVRMFDRRKPRCRNIGQSRVHSIAERQREYYNRDSELILSDTTQAHPLLEGPEDYIKADGTIPIGPSWLLPKKKNQTGGSVSYEGFSVVDFPKGGAESIRRNKQDIRDDVDRDAGLMKPAGSVASGGSGGTGQSGISKMLDHDAQHAKLSSVAKMMAKGEKAKFLPMVAKVVYNGNPPEDLLDQIEIAYPSVFSLYAAEDLAKIAADFMTLLDQSGAAPEPEAAMICELARKALPGRDDDTYDAFDLQIIAAVEAKATAKNAMAESMGTAAPPGQNAASEIQGNPVGVPALE